MNEQHLNNFAILAVLSTCQSLQNSIENTYENLLGGLEGSSVSLTRHAISGAVF